MDELYNMFDGRKHKVRRRETRDIVQHMFATPLHVGMHKGFDLASKKNVSQIVGMFV